MGKNYYSERYQPQSAEGKCAWHEVQGRLGIGFQGFLSCAVTQDKFHLLVQVVIPHVRCCQLGEFVGSLRAQSFYWGLISLCLLGTQIVDFQKECRCSAQTIEFVYTTT